MILFKKIKDLSKWIDAQRKKDITVGFVPTMGALHAGHISLIDASNKKNDITVSSIFVNPAQFNDPSDFKKYPVTIEQDIYLLEEAGCNVLLLPYVNEIYPEGSSLKMQYDLGFPETILEGRYRQDHFQGVCMVVHRLLEIVKPDRLYLGQKDYQQCMVIKNLMEIIDAKNKIEIVICPTLREPDGLAMSSRNLRLNETERKKSTTIYHCLDMIREQTGKKTPAELKMKAHSMLVEAGFIVDYVEIADADNLISIKEWKDNQKNIALIAATINEVRLIDNMLLN